MLLHPEHFVEAEVRAKAMLENASTEDAKWALLGGLIEQTRQNENRAMIAKLQADLPPDEKDDEEDEPWKGRPSSEAIAQDELELVMPALMMEAMRDLIVPGVDRVRWRKLGWSRARSKGGETMRLFFHKVRLLRATGQI